MVIHTGSRVVACERSGDGWTMRTNHGSVTARWVIVSTDAYSGYNGPCIAPGTVFGCTLAQLIPDKKNEAELPLQLSDPKEPALRPLKELYYEVCTQAAHFVGERF